MSSAGYIHNHIHNHNYMPFFLTVIPQSNTKTWLEIRKSSPPQIIFQDDSPNTLYVVWKKIPLLKHVFLQYDYYNSSDIDQAFLLWASLFKNFKKICLTHSTSILIAINMKYYGYKISIFKITLMPVLLRSVYPSIYLGSC